MKSTHRPARTAAALASAALLVGAFSSAGSASAAATAAPEAAQLRSLNYQPTVSLGPGKRKVRFLTCKSGSEGNYTVYYKATTRRSSDRVYPRIGFKIAEGGAQASGEFSLFPGDLSQASKTGLWGSAADMRITLRLMGKVKKKQLTVGQMGAC